MKIFLFVGLFYADCQAQVADFIIRIKGKDSVVTQVKHSIVYAQVKIINVKTKQLVDANITCKSEPNGDKTNFFQGNTYSIPLYDNKSYYVTVKANGFMTAKFLLDPKSAGSDFKINKDVELVPSDENAIGTIEVGSVIRLSNLIFKVGTDIIEPSSQEELDNVLNMLIENPRMVIQLEGHTDAIGDSRLNMELSQSRVDAVKKYLVSKGAKRSSIETKAFGDTQPFTHGTDEASRKLNRRVEFRVLKK